MSKSDQNKHSHELDGLSEVQLLARAQSEKREDFQLILAKDPNDLVRGALLSNPHLHDAVFKILKRDESDHVQLKLREVRGRRAKLEIAEVVRDVREQIKNNH